MESLINLQTNIPSWIARLGDLKGEIDQRQKQLAESQGPEPVRPLRNKGSTESLKPRDEPMAHSDTAVPPVVQSPEPVAAPPPPQTAGTPPSNGLRPASLGGESSTPSALKRHTNQVVAVSQARARATVRKRNRTGSVVSAEGAGDNHQTHNTIIIYYDSYVQSFFEELVRFVSASRYLMRKARMAAKVAELQLPDDDGDKPSNPNDPFAVATSDESDLPRLNYQLRPISRTPTYILATGRPMYSRAAARAAPGGIRGGQQPDVYDKLDICLEKVQSMSEHAAHQFLRHGDCTDKIDEVKRQLIDAKTLADQEMARVQEELAVLPLPLSAGDIEEEIKDEGHS